MGEDGGPVGGCPPSVGGDIALWRVPPAKPSLTIALARRSPVEALPEKGLANEAPA